MSIGLLKRLLKLGNLVAILAIGGAAWAFWDHRQEIQQPWTPPDFVPRTEKRQGRSSRIEAIGMQLGSFPKPQEHVPEAKDDQPKENIESVLDRLGKIKSAVVVYPPYRGIFPALIFELASGDQRVTIKLNEALVSKPHPQHGNLLPKPVAYKFIGCEPDPKHPGWTYFLFDMRCDGTDIQKARWKGETDERNPLVDGNTGLPSGALVGDKPGTIYIGPDPLEEVVKKAEDDAKAATEGGTETKVVGAGETPGKPPEQLEVLPEQINISDAPSGPIFEEESGTFNPTREGMDYLENNYEKVLEDAETRTYRDPKTRRASGIRIVRLRGMANEFGLYPDDVIVSINDKPVTRQSQAVSVVKEELKKAAVKILRVKILRRGRTIEKRYDTRDPDLRAKARRSGFGRG